MRRVLVLLWVVVGGMALVVPRRQWLHKIHPFDWKPTRLQRLTCKFLLRSSEGRMPLFGCYCW